MNGWQDIMARLGEALALEKELGVSAVELSPDVAKFVRSAATAPAGTSSRNIPQQPVAAPVSEASPCRAVQVAFLTMTPVAETTEEHGVFMKMVHSMGLSPDEWALFSLQSSPVRDPVSMRRDVDSLVGRLKTAKPEVMVIFGADTARAVVADPASIRTPGQWISLAGIPAVLTRELGLVVRLQNAGDAVNLRTIKMEMWNRAMVPALDKIGRQPSFKK